MNGTLWARRPAPELDVRSTCVWHWELRAPRDLTTSRIALREAVLNRSLPCDAAVDDLDRLLLTFEELASNGLRHGRGPVTVTVTATAAGWLIDVSDAATTRSPAPAVDRDPAQGGLGLHLVARLSSTHGWWVRAGRKHVWACVTRAAVA
ncbi:MAG: Signal transduction histidine kinase [Blastococcus sp.]|jgi:two-component sensor histidine kinase|nr:Signal transduction histidine kinase [Blastococcus sp.]